MSDDLGGDEPLLNRAQIAQIFNVSENTIDKWRARGMPVEVEGGNGVPYGFLFSACKAWVDETRRAADEEKSRADAFVAQQRMAFLGVDTKKQKAGLSPAQMRELAQAELVWMQAAKQRRALVHTDEMVDLLDAILSEVRAALDGQPDWLEREFSLTGDQVERVVAYNDEVLRAMQAAISAAALSERPEVVDEGDRGLF